MVGTLITAAFGVATALAPTYDAYVALLFVANAGQTAIFQVLRHGLP